MGGCGLIFLVDRRKCHIIRSDNCDGGTLWSAGVLLSLYYSMPFLPSSCMPQGKIRSLFLDIKTYIRMTSPSHLTLPPPPPSFFLLPSPSLHLSFWVFEKERRTYFVPHEMSWYICEMFWFSGASLNRWQNVTHFNIFWNCSGGLLLKSCIEFLLIWKYFQKVPLTHDFCLFMMMYLLWNDVRLAKISRWSTANKFWITVKCKVNAGYRCVCLKAYWLCVRG